MQQQLWSHPFLVLTTLTLFSDLSNGLWEQKQMSLQLAGWLDFGAASADSQTHSDVLRSMMSTVVLLLCVGSASSRDCVTVLLLIHIFVWLKILVLGLSVLM